MWPLLTARCHTYTQTSTCLCSDQKPLAWKLRSFAFWNKSLLFPSNCFTADSDIRSAFSHRVCLKTNQSRIIKFILHAVLLMFTKEAVLILYLNQNPKYSQNHLCYAKQDDIHGQRPAGIIISMSLFEISHLFRRVYSQCLTFVPFLFLNYSLLWSG